MLVLFDLRFRIPTEGDELRALVHVASALGAGASARSIRIVASVYRWVDHTAEVELHVEAATREEIFSEALAAFAELVAGDERGEPAEFELELEARDDATLLADWLGELVFLAETEDFVPERVSAITLEDTHLRARVTGSRGRPSHLVKGVTYHGLELAAAGDTWRAKVVLDV